MEHLGIHDLIGDPARCARLLAEFDAEMRIDPPVEPGARCERVADIVRLRGANNFVSWWNFAPADADAVVRTQAEYFRSIVEPLEWKVYGHDRPSGLSAALERAGFSPDEGESLMLCDLRLRDAGVRVPMHSDADIREIVDMAGLADLVAVTERAFDCDAQWMLTELPQRLFVGDPCTVAHVAYVDGAPASGGRLDLPKQRSFASMWGGGTAPAYRRRGLFSAVIEWRIERARRAGYRYVTVDARESSRGILERHGFSALTSIVGWQCA